MDKFGRNYQISLEKPDASILVIQLPFSLEFDVTRNILSSTNSATFRLYNLSLNNRNDIRKNQYDWGTFRSIQLAAGYGQSNLPVCFAGTITDASSVRENVNYITTINCYDGGFAEVNSTLAQTFPKGSTVAGVMEGMVKTLPGVTPGVIGNYPATLTRGNSYNGNTTDVLKDLSGGGFFIDNGKAHILNDNEVIEGEIPLINASTGLLGTPVLQDTFISFDMIFEPRLLIGQLIALDPSTAPQLKGSYKVISVKHSGMISPVVCGDAKTTVGLAYGLGELKVVK